MTARDFAGLTALTAGGFAAGLVISSVGALILGIVGAGLGIVVVRARIRWAVAIPVVIGTATGAVLGWAVTHAFCRPQGCPVGESIAATLAGIGSLVGVGLVVALATRSFDEYRETAAERFPAGDGGTEPPQ